MASASQGVEKELIDLERRYWQAIQDKDAETAARLSDDPCIVTGPQGVGSIGRAAMTEMMKAPRYTLRGFKLGDDVQVRLISDDVAVVAYKVRSDMTVEGKPVSVDAADTSTWVRRDGSWVCAAHSEAIAGDPYGRDRRGASA